VLRWLSQVDILGMPRISLNLLPAEQKKYIEVMFNYKYLRIITFLILTFAVIAAGVVLSSRLLLQDNLNDLLTSSLAITQKNTNLDQQITQLNAELKNISTIQNDFVKWSTVTASILATIPLNIELNYFNIEKQSGRFDLNGRARERTDYLKLSENLSQLTYLEKLNSPLTNLLLRQNVDFQLNGHINLNKFSQP